MHGFNYAMIVTPSFHSLCKEHLAQSPPFCVLINMTKNTLQITSLAAFASEAKNRERQTANKPI